eukprot:869634-Alexandrium_andersonii.AAC.1
MTRKGGGLQRLYLSSQSSDRVIDLGITTWKSDFPRRCFGPDPGGGLEESTSQGRRFGLGGRYFDCRGRKVDLG